MGGEGVLTDEQIEARIADRRERPKHRWIKTLKDQAVSLIETLQLDDGIGLGLLEVDVLTRGFRGTDLVIITGFAHSGKTQLVNTMILNNPSKRVLFFSLDDPAEMILAKLVAMYSEMSSLKVEQRVREGDEGVKRMLTEIAEHQFPNLFVVDDVIGIPQMQDAVAEATEAWGAPPDCVILDYVEMMPGNGHSEDQGSNVKQKINALKGWAKQATYPIIALHQGTRSNAKMGEPITLLSMGFSGEQQATIVIGCRRKRDKEDLEAWERQNHEHTITVHVVKNKRPGGKMTHFDGVDFHMNPDTGLISKLRDPSTLSVSELTRSSMKQTELDV
jgi:replicative DNA helicase